MARALAELRRGVGKEPGTVPELWPHYTQLNDRGSVTPNLRAEHLALTLFGMHQQSHPQPMHISGRSLGRAMREYHLATRDSAPGSDGTVDAVDRRLAAAATAASFSELSEHLRGIVSLLSSEDIALDYDLLYRHLLDWQDPRKRGRVVRRWGSDYFLRPHGNTTGEHAPQGPNSHPRTTNKERGQDNDQH